MAQRRLRFGFWMGALSLLFTQGAQELEQLLLGACRLARLHLQVLLQKQKILIVQLFQLLVMTSQKAI